MKTEMIDISTKSNVKIPVVFADLVPDIKDYIAYVRKQYPDPWTRIYLKTDTIPAGSTVMKEANIYCYFTEQELENVKGQEQDVLLGIEDAFLIITKELLVDSNKSTIRDALKHSIASFQQKANLSIFDVLLYFEEMSEENIALLNQIHDIAASEYFSSDLHFIYPKKFEKHLRIDTENIDIVRHMDAIRDARNIRKFSKELLDDLIAFVLQEHEKGKTKITYSGFESFSDLRYVVPYLYLKYGLEFIYPDSLLTWTTNSNYIYLYNRLSLYERLRFVQKLPEAFCYNIDKLFQRVDCRLKSYTTPSIVAVYDFETCEEVEISINWTKDTFVDFREFFIDKEPIVADTKINVNHENFADYETDKMLVDKFMKMDIDKYITVKNSILMSRDGKLYLVYTKGDFSLDVILQIQNVIPISQYTIDEVNFYRIYSHPILKKVVGEVKPAYSIEVRLLSFLCNENPSTLSYYERALRWCSIMEDEDIDIFKEISLATIRQQPTSKYFISCFGNPLNFSKQVKANVPLKVTNKIMEGKRLP